jgi:hypothetical protein
MSEMTTFLLASIFFWLMYYVKVRKDEVVFATMTVAQADPITILTTIETD